MAADVFGTYMVLAMGLFTVTSLIIGYFLLNQAVVGAARGSAYYSYLRINEALSSSIKSLASTITNINFNPRYVIFSAYFGSEEEIYYNIVDGIRLFMYGIPNNDVSYFNSVKSSIQNSYSNQGQPSRQELKKCIGQPCMCFAELDSIMKLDDDHFIPLACVDICWGEKTSEYTSNVGSSGTIAERINSANNYISDNYPTSKCHKCVEYMNSAKYQIMDFGEYSIVSTDFDRHETNDNNLETLKEFSESTKFSFLTEIIECKSFSEIIADSGTIIPSLAFSFGNETDYGTFAMIVAKDNIIFKLLAFEHLNIGPQRAYTKTTLARAEKSSSQLLGGQ